MKGWPGCRVAGLNLEKSREGTKAQEKKNGKTLTEL